MTSKTMNQFPPQARALAVRMGFNHEARHASRWAAITSSAGKISCTGQTLNGSVKEAESDSGRKLGLTRDMMAKLKATERENRELRQANEIPSKEPTCLAQPEFDRRPVQRSGLLHHFDHDPQFIGVLYTKRLTEAGLEPFVRDVGETLS